MIREEDLAKRTWPKESTFSPEEIARSSSPFVRDGRMINRRLCLHQAVSEPIPPGECAITSLTRGSNGKIYGATSGARSHLFFHDPGPEADGVFDLGVIPGAAGVHRALVSADHNIIIGGITSGAEGYLFSYDGSDDGMNEFAVKHGALERLEVPVPGEEIAGLTIDRQRNVVYGISRKTGTFFSYSVAERTVSRKGPVDRHETFSPVLVVDGTGKVFGTGAFGALFCYDPETDVLAPLDRPIPGLAGRELYNGFDSAVFSPHDNRIYAGGSGDGVLFALDPAGFSFQALGKPGAESGCPALTVGNDGRVYGINGEQEGMARLFRYDPASRCLDDLGLPHAAQETFWHGHQFASACTGPFGEIYLGEADRISHLFIYFPPIPRRF